MDGHQHLVLLMSLIGLVSTSLDVFPLDGRPDAGYYVKVEIGTPPRLFNLLLDTGSSNLAVAAYNNVNVTRYFNSSQSKSYQSTNKKIEVSYTQGHWSGVLGKDLVQLFPGTAPSILAEIALIQVSSEFFENGSGWHGILGLGFSEISIETVDHYKPIPYFDSLVQKARIPNAFSLQLCGPEDGPFSDDIAMGGKFSLGYVNKAEYTGELFTASLVQPGYYQVTVTDIQVNRESLGMACMSYNNPKAIVDSGTTNLRLPNDVFTRVVQRLRHHSTASSHNISLDELFWRGERPLCTPHGYNKSLLYNLFPSFSLHLLHVHSESLVLNILPEQYMRPVSSAPHTDCYKIGISASTAGTVIGAVIMEGFYIYFDRENKTVAFGETTCPKRVPNATSQVSGYITSATLTSCNYKPPTETHLPTYAIVLIAIGSILVCMFLMMAVIKIAQKIRRRRSGADADYDATLMAGVFDTDY